MEKTIKRLIVVGGGSAGWLSAGIIAAQHTAKLANAIEIYLIESPQVSSIGVGEGTWPSMRNTLQKIGIKEQQFLSECDASFKQGSRFIAWHTGLANDVYYHPFMTPRGYGEVDLHQAWRRNAPEKAFADAINIQSQICLAGLAPKQQATPPYAAVTNYGYHLDALKFAQLLQRHCTKELGVKHIIGHVNDIINDEHGDICAIVIDEHGTINGDFFIDCSGAASLLLGKHYGIEFISQKSTLFNDTALAVQVDYSDDDAPIESVTLSTAQSAGWIWDIGLPTRRGVGYVFSSTHINIEQANQELHDYLAPSIGEQQAAQLQPRKISFNPGYRAKFWHKNCVAIGMSAGFIEPLEASALALVELSATMISEQLPVNRSHMAILAGRFNQCFEYRWQRIIEFLKLHYVISERQGAYWQDNRQAASIPTRLQQLLTLWRFQPPSRYDFNQLEEIFPSASYQYILYGMGFNTEQRELPSHFAAQDIGTQLINDNQQKTEQCIAGLPSNRALLDYLTKELYS